jgi:hypothetical protein
MTKKEVAKVKRNLKKYGFKPNNKLKELYCLLYKDLLISVIFREPLTNTYFMSVTMDLEDDYELAISSILDYDETNPQRFFDIVDHFNGAIKFINR